MSRGSHTLKVGNTVWCHWQGRTYSVEIGKKKGSQQGSQSQAAFDGFVRSPMPGKILKVSCSPGGAVKKGQTICVLEAMKMEYSLKSPIDGSVVQLLKAAGDLVQLDDKIAEIK